MSVAAFLAARCLSARPQPRIYRSNDTPAIRRMFSRWRYDGGRGGACSVGIDGMKMPPHPEASSAGQKRRDRGTVGHAARRANAAYAGRLAGYGGK